MNPKRTAIKLFFAFLILVVAFAISQAAQAEITSQPIKSQQLKALKDKVLLKYPKKNAWTVVLAREAVIGSQGLTSESVSRFVDSLYQNETHDYVANIKLVEESQMTTSNYAVSDFQTDVIGMAKAEGFTTMIIGDETGPFHGSRFVVVKDNKTSDILFIARRWTE